MLRRIPRRFRDVVEHFVDDNDVRLLRDGVEVFPEMLAAIGSAERQILLEMYWFDSDAVGRRFAGALAEAAGRGVEVALLFDSLGSWTADRDMFLDLARAGVKVVEFNPLAPWAKRFRVGRLTRRDHRKVLIVDGATAFVGGINLADAWAPASEGGGGWRDDAVRVDGPAVRGLIECFERGWRAENGPRLQPVVEGPIGRAGSQSVRVLSQDYAGRRRDISNAYLFHIYRAEQRVWIGNSYFLPDRKVVKALVSAARRGVDVRVIMAGDTDMPVVRHASRAVWGNLMRGGVRLYEWFGSIFHSKTAVIDGLWSTIGSFNLDNLSFVSNLEINVAVLDEQFGAVMEASMQRDFDLAKEVDQHEFRFRSLGDRLLELICYRFRKFL